DLKSVARALRAAPRVLLTSHQVPDGDSIGALLALGLGLEQLGKQVELCLDDEVPLMYRFLEGSERIVRPAAVEVIPEMVVLLDCTGIERAGAGLAPRLKHSLVINLDHHTSNEHFGSINYVDETAAATAEIVYDLLSCLGVAMKPPIASAIYTGIITDTGSFRYSNTTPRTLRLAADLLEGGIDLDTIREKIFETRTLEMLRLLGECLRSLQVDPDGRLAWVVVTQETLSRLKVTDEYGLFEGLINYPRSIAGVEVAILFRELAPMVVKVGFRSKSWVDVNELASRFGGGGHRKASGCVIGGEIDQVVPQVLDAAREALKLAPTGAGDGRSG
ncbi:MAG: bifunctional oligoribonuclease/PAP phosphatase NrnA, partial [Syntrophomonadaceae bacterium]|nr:bifunctional oligoribonuclease/PAP phosphatase NrnA [Syntrophomonadaceae bacterium]